MKQSWQATLPHETNAQGELVLLNERYFSFICKDLLVMGLSKEQIEQLQRDIANAMTYDDLMGKAGAIKKLLKTSLETILEAENTEALGYEKHFTAGNNVRQ